LIIDVKNVFYVFYFGHVFAFLTFFLFSKRFLFKKNVGKVQSGKQINNTHPFNGPFSGTTHVSRYQNGKTNLDFTEARDSDWQWHQLGHMQVCTSLQTDNHASTPPLSFLQAGCPSCRPTNSIKALKAQINKKHFHNNSNELQWVHK